MANSNSTPEGIADGGAKCSIRLDDIDRINERLTKAIAIVRLIGEPKMDIDVVGDHKNAAWAAWDLVDEAKKILNDGTMKADHNTTKRNPL